MRLIFICIQNKIEWYISNAQFFIMILKSLSFGREIQQQKFTKSWKIAKCDLPTKKATFHKFAEQIQ